MGEFISTRGARWENVETTTLFIGTHPETHGLSIADAVTSQQVLLLPEEVAPLIAALQAKLPTPTTAPEAEVNDGE